jgi:hypothetical protein
MGEEVEKFFRTLKKGAKNFSVLKPVKKIFPDKFLLKHG